MISKFPLFTSNLSNIKDYRFDVFAYLKSVYRPHQATQSVLVCLNTHRQEMVFAFFYPKSGKSNVNTVDNRLDDIACVLSLDHHHLKANFLPDSDKHLSLNTLSDSMLSRKSGCFVKHLSPCAST